MSGSQIIVGDCVEEMAKMPADSVDAVVCDPPYMLTSVSRNGSARQNDESKPYGRHKLQSAGGFMGKKWDAPDENTPRGMQAWHELWAREAFRVLKPGGFAVVAGGTRTFHRLVCALEDAGFEIRDTIAHIYGSGFPKSKSMKDIGHPELGTALKPAFEPWTVARKPLSEKNVAQNVLAHGTGAINVDATRVRSAESWNGNAAPYSGHNGYGPSDADGWSGNWHKRGSSHEQGRWPPNLLLSHHELCKPTGEVRRVKKPGGLGEASKFTGTGMFDRSKQPSQSQHYDPDGREPQEVWECVAGCPVNLLGEPARFFPCFETEAPFRYVAKASRRERNAGLEGMPEKAVRDGGNEFGKMHMWNGENGDEAWKAKNPNKPTANPHPTVKPIALMRWLVRLVTPPGGVVLDPFAGSGSTGCAAVLEGFNFIGIEQDAEYAEIARRRIAYWSTPEHLRPQTKTQANPIQGYRFGEAGARKVPRCPQHDETFLSGETTYKCGCKFEWTNEPKAPDPTDPTFSGRLF